MQDPTNVDRAEYARAGLQAFVRRTHIGDENVETQLGDFITDLMHLADLEGVSFDAVLQRAYTYYRHEALEFGRATRDPRSWSPRKRQR